MKKPKVLMLVETGNGKGHLNSVNTLALAMAKKGYDVYISTSDFADTKEKLSDNNVNTIDLPPMLKPNTQILIRGNLGVRKKIQNKFTDKLKFDVFIVEGFPYQVHQAYCNEVKALVGNIKKNNPDSAIYSFVPDYGTLKNYAPTPIVNNNTVFLKNDPFLYKIYSYLNKIIGNNIVKKLKDKTIKKVSNLTNPYDLIRKDFDKILKLGNTEIKLGEEDVEAIEFRKAGKLLDIGYFKPENIPSSIKYNKDGPIIVTMGSYLTETGALLFNQSLEMTEFLPDELRNKKIHFFAPEQNGFYNDFIKKTEILNDNNIIIHKVGHEFKELLPKASVVMHLCGLNTHNDLAYMGIPSISYPAGEGDANEQILRAHASSKAGLTVIISKEELNDPKKFVAKVTEAYKDRGTIEKASANFRANNDAASKVIEIINEDLLLKLEKPEQNTHKEKEGNINITQANAITPLIEKNLGGFEKK